MSGFLSKTAEKLSDSERQKHSQENALPLLERRPNFLLSTWTLTALGELCNSTCAFLSSKLENSTELANSKSYISELPVDLQRHTAHFFEAEDLFTHKSLFSPSLSSALAGFEAEFEDVSEYFDEKNRIDYDYSDERCVVSLVNAFPHFRFQFIRDATNEIPKIIENNFKISEIRIFNNLTKTEIANFVNLLENSKIKCVWVNLSLGPIISGEVWESFCEQLSHANHALSRVDFYNPIDTNALSALKRGLAGSGVDTLVLSVLGRYCSVESLVEFIETTSLKHLELLEMFDFNASELSVILEAVKASALESVVIGFKGKNSAARKVLKSAAQAIDSLIVAFLA